MKVASKLFRPKASEVLTAYLKQCNEPEWTSYFVKHIHVSNDQWGKSHFNWTLDTGTNYHILRTGCFPYIKYHCTKRKYEDLTAEDLLFGLFKLVNLGVPLFLYGFAAICLISHTEFVDVKGKTIPIYFLYKENKRSKY